MTGSLFCEWLRNWDKELDHKILLLVDNCTVYIIGENLKNINVVLFHADTTSLIQPCNQGIIRSSKAYYWSERRKFVIGILVNGFENATFYLRANDIARKISLLDALHLSASPWIQVSSATVRNYFIWWVYAKR